MDDQQQQMPCWYYEREELYKTPSYYDSIDHETELRHRQEGARFLFDVSNKLNLRYDTCATAIVFFHRFYMFHSFKTFPRYVTAACCLMLAGKVEETPKKVRDIVKTARSLLLDEDFEQFGNDPREEVMAYERVLLKTIKFDLQVSHPYSYLLQFVKRIKGNQDKLKELVQMSWSFINDSLATTLCLQWEPEIVACAVLYLATRMSKFTIEDWEGRQSGLRWWECFVEGMSTEVMEDICHKILDLYPADGGPSDTNHHSDGNNIPTNTNTSVNTKTVTTNTITNDATNSSVSGHQISNITILQDCPNTKYIDSNNRNEPAPKRIKTSRQVINDSFNYKQLNVPFDYGSKQYQPQQHRHHNHQSQSQISAPPPPTLHQKSQQSQSHCSYMTSSHLASSSISSSSAPSSIPLITLTMGHVLKNRNIMK